MELQEWDNALNEELGIVNEGIRDMVSKLWSKVKGVKKQTIQKAAQMFFKKHPELLQAVKAKFGQAQTSEALQALEEANKFQKGMMTVAVILALLGGIIKPASASEQIRLTDLQGSRTQVNYITNMQDALQNMESENFIDSLIGSYVVDSAGNYTFIQNAKEAQAIMRASRGNYDDVLIFSDSELEKTGGVSSAERARGMSLQRHLAGVN